MGEFEHPEDRLLTIEVTNRDRAVVQVRGKMNRPAKSHEKKWVEKWAGENGLSVRDSMWGRWM